MSFAIGILGGSFDPVHLGHMRLAEAAHSECGLDKLLFVPAYQAPLKPSKTGACARDRLAMLEIAVEKLSFSAEIETFEICRNSISYSIDTARYLAGKYPKSRLIWIIGADHVQKLHLWKDIEELLGIVEFACAARPGYAIDKTLLPAGARVGVINFDPVEISSSQIREALSCGKNLNSMLDADVISYIKSHNLYK